jgi:hypothetical protein
LYQGDHQRALAHFRQSLAACVHVGNQRKAAVALLGSGMAAYAAYNSDAAFLPPNLFSAHGRAAIKAGAYACQPT